MPSPSERVRARLAHPVIDADGHVLEFMPAVLPYLRESLGARLFESYTSDANPLGRIMHGGAGGQRTRTRTPQSAWWGTPARNTRDLATAALPRLMYQRLDEFGIDFAVLYGTKSFGSASPGDPELRQGLCRGYNDFYADVYGPFSDRMTAAGLIPMHTPEEALVELDHCKEIGLKVVAFPEGVRREIAEPDPDGASPFLMPGQRHWFDTFGLDSAYDYDPVWRRCEELGFAVTCHGGVGSVSPFRFTSPTNYTYNHIGSFADPMHRLVKSLYMGGVTRRFPKLNFAVLECGVGWAAILLADAIEHWHKRSLAGLENLDPARIDWEELEALVQRHGAELVPEGTDLRRALEALPGTGSIPENLDDWRFLEVAEERELVELFAPRFYFGCEADDRTIAFAFAPGNPLRARLQPVFSSDLSHWDVPEMDEVLSEAWELIEEGTLDEQDFREFVCRNPAKLFLDQNPAFFDGTVVEGAALLD
jgi:predicted TIM-barrel fold metal-dependent hydrolase